MTTTTNKRTTKSKTLASKSKKERSSAIGIEHATHMRIRIAAILLVIFSIFGIVNASAASYDPSTYDPIKPLPTLATGKSTREKIIAIAESQIGYAERAVDRTAYGAWFHDETGKQGFCAWCAIFVSWVNMKAGAGSLITYTYTAGAYSFGL